jgi:hypothetical protein
MTRAATGNGLPVVGDGLGGTIYSDDQAALRDVAQSMRLSGLYRAPGGEQHGRGRGLPH